MIFDGRWKYVHFEKMRPQLYDLAADPIELNELGSDPQHSDQIALMQAMNFAWSRKHYTRLARDCETIEKATDRGAPPGVLIGYATKAEVAKDGRFFPADTSR